MNETTEKKKHPGYKRWVFVFVIIGVLVHGGVFFLFTLELKETPYTEPQDGFVFFQPQEIPLASDELEQRAFLFDSEPIFLPTTRNFSGPIKTDASVWEPEVSLSAAFPPDIRWDDSLLLMEPGITGGSGTPLELLQPIDRDFVSEFGAEKKDPLETSSRGLFVEAKNSDGIMVLKTFIELEEEVEVDFPLNRAEFSILHTDFGLAGDPLLVSPSGSETTDKILREFILEKVHPLLLGTNGYFHIRFGL
ncbi:MAG: hypothetical protein O7C75_20910 [Verrucomicrobia bacterium]|nr:hypothetical protein [Verrucomicrobiota bacterium]